MHRTARLSCLFLVAIASLALAQVRPLPHFPDVAGRQTLVCDLHIHTVFSDGLVWPTVRVDEALREGLDAIALTDHIEYQPHRDDLPTNHNRPHALAAGRARERGILLVHAAEITRGTPPGHYNALFVKDTNALVISDFNDCLAEAGRQGAFVFWNHHAWKGEDRGRWTPVQSHLLERELLGGMEVANGGTYYPLAHRWCLERGLTLVGNSDIHGPSIDYHYTAAEHRTLTLVFVDHRCTDCLRDALRKGRTAVWYNNSLIGRPDILRPLLAACVTVGPPRWVNDKTLALELTNRALIDLDLERTGRFGPSRLTLPAQSRYQLRIPVAPGEDRTPLRFRVNNLLVAPGQGLEETLTLHHPPRP